MTHSNTSFPSTLNWLRRACGPRLAFALATGCGAADPELAGFADGPSAQLSEAVMGATESPPYAGIIAVQITGQSNVHTALQLSDRLVITSSAWLNWQTRPADVSVRFGAGNGATGTAKTARFVNSSDYYPASIIQVAPTVGNRPGIDGRSNAQLLGVVLRCFEFSSSSRLRAVDVSVTGSNGNTLSAQTTFLEPGVLESVDLGAPCLDLVTNTAVGFLSAQSGAVSTLYRLSALQPWLDGMANLAEIRVRPGATGPVALYTTPNATSRFCLDIPWGGPFPNFPLNQYPCHYGPAQRFWFDFSADPSNPRLVSESSGLCVDVPSASRDDGVNLQQYPCHMGTNQRFEMTLWNDAVGGIKFRPLQALSLNRCLSIEGGPSTVNGPVPAEQRSCAAATLTNTDQRWFMNVL